MYSTVYEEVEFFIYYLTHPMAVTKAQKDEVLKQLEENFAKAKAVYFAQNKGLQVKKVTDLRKKLYKEGVELVVAKKTLMKLAAKKNNLPELSDEVMDGPIAAAFGFQDMISPAKVLYDFSKENENLQLLGAIVEGKLLNKAEAKQLATLPSRTELLAKLVGSMKSPISGFHGVLAGTLRKFVYGLKAVHDKKAAETPAA
jgi:large subunit ribosomal protein L10